MALGMRGLETRASGRPEGAAGWNPKGLTRSHRLDAASTTPLQEYEPETFDTFVTLATNIQAVEATLLFTAGLQTFACLVGPSGWGKTHLLNAAAFRLKRELGRGWFRVVDACEWATRPSHVDPSAPLLIDNAQDALARGRLRVPFRLALERRVRAGRPTLIATTADRVDRSTRANLPMHREWAIAGISEPERAERGTLVHRIAQTEGLTLGPCTELLLAKGLHGNGRTVRGALARLKQHGPDWPDQRAALRACGIADPFFADNSQWDLAGAIRDTARDLDASPELTAYLLLRVALLPEAAVARSLGWEPAAVYLRASKCEAALRVDPSPRSHIEAVVAAVVQRLNAL